jgi:hypothetical protein
MKNILVLGSSLDALLIAEALNKTGSCEAFALVAPEHGQTVDPIPLTPKTDPSPVLMCPEKPSVHPNPDPRVLPEKSVRMRAKRR